MKARILIVTLMVTVLLAPMARAADYVLVANKDNPVNSLSAGDVKNMFMGKKTVWSSGQKVDAFTQSGSSVHNSFVKEITGKSTQQFSTYWKKILFTGKGIPPVDLSGDGAMKQRVARSAGGLGYISAGSLDASVKLVEIR